MYIKEIQVSVSKVRGVGPKLHSLFSKLEIETVGDLLSHWPRDWEDRTIFHPLSEYQNHQKINVQATILHHEWFGFARMKTLKLLIKDTQGTTAELICFNRPFLEKSFPIGSKVVVYGSFYWKYGSIQASSFEIEHTETAQTQILPIYPLTTGISQSIIRKTIQYALKEYGKGIQSELPKEIQKEFNIPEKQAILFSMHSPSSLEEAYKAKEALIFEELFFYEYALGKRSLERRGTLPDLASISNSKPLQSLEQMLTPLQQHCISRLPYSLTPDQKTSLVEINQDLQSASVMARLLQGDVGSGKTLIAFLACLAVIQSGGQCALMAPTELLARQHAENAAQLLEPLGIQLAFLTGNTKTQGRKNLLEELKKGTIQIIIGTHALFSNSVEYNNLKLVIIDEQHRFGVLQRSAIIEKGIQSSKDAKPPHLLMMSATPIPRTLALSVFGDLDISTIKTMPLGRKEIQTHLAVHGKEQKVYDFVKTQLALGKQAYFVYPLIEETDGIQLRSAEQMYVELKEKIFPESNLALIHSQIPEEEQRSIMFSFKKGTTQILVATSVVEVGVDVPNATCMVIEHAERFGLSALHQLRGRVGRGLDQSYCFLVYAPNLTEIAKQRLKVLHETQDGFLISEQDLILRGPGDIGGIQQSGYIAFTIADPIRDSNILEKARHAAFSYLKAL